MTRALAWARDRRWRSLGLGALLLVPAFLVVHLDVSHLGLTFTDEVGHQNLGFLYLADGDRRQAQAEFQRAVSINPDTVNAWLALARLEAADGDAAAEQRTLRSLLDHADHRRADGVEILDPAAEGMARQRLGRLLRAVGRNEEAAAEFRRAADRLPGDPAPLVDLGITLRAAGHLDAAAAAYREALDRDAGDPLALYNLANVELERGDRQQALSRLEAALASCNERRPDLCERIRARFDALRR